MHKKNLLLIDTGFFVALSSKKDHYHKSALALRPLIDDRQWITTWPVLTEVCYLLGKENTSKASQILQLYQTGAFAVFDLALVHAHRIGILLEKYRDLPMDLADASLVITAEDCECGDIVSTDQRDFKTYRFKNHKPFHNLLSPQ